MSDPRVHHRVTGNIGVAEGAVLWKMGTERALGRVVFIF